MTIFSVLKKLFSKKPEPACYHYKRAGYPTLKNMACVIRFDERSVHKPFKCYDYGVYECNVCGKRAFSTPPCHLLHPDVAQKVDEFIGYKISISELCNFFDHNNFEYEEEKNDQPRSTKTRSF